MLPIPLHPTTTTTPTGAQSQRLYRCFMDDTWSAEDRRIGQLIAAGMSKGGKKGGKSS